MTTHCSLFLCLISLVADSLISFFMQIHEPLTFILPEIPHQVSGKSSNFTARSFVRNLMNKDPEKRYTCEEALSDPW